MKIVEVKNRISELINCLLEVWEGSVKATHLFLSDREIKNIKEYVPQALKNVEHWEALLSSEVKIIKRFL